MTFDEQDLDTARFVLLLALNIASTGVGIAVAGFGGALVGFAAPWILLSVITFAVNHYERRANAKEESK